MRRLPKYGKQLESGGVEFTDKTVAVPASGSEGRFERRLAVRSFNVPERRKPAFQIASGVPLRRRGERLLLAHGGQLLFQLQ